MPGGQERVLRRRIKSVQSTKKITRAMELIAATRVVKAQQRAAAARPYARQITQVIENLAAGGASVDHPLMRRTENVRKVAFVAITSDRGLAGAYNSSVIRAAERQLNGHRDEGRDYSLILIGRKAEGYFRFRNYRIDHSFTGVSDTPKYSDAREIARVIADKFIAEEVDQVELIYTEFVSMGSQRVAVRRFLPLESTTTIATGGSGAPQALAEFEPSPEAVLAALLPRYVEARLFGAMLEGSASEHASRQRAMKAATDNAEELRIKLTRLMNRARQDAITTEIMEIVGGAEALRAGGDELAVEMIELGQAFAGPARGAAPAAAYGARSTTAGAVATGIPSGGAGSSPLSAEQLREGASIMGKRIAFDDLKIVEGIGPAIEQLCHRIGITTWAQLASTPVETIRQMLRDGGQRFVTWVDSAGSWPTQAGLAAAGKFAELKELQDNLTGGRAE